MPVTLTGLEATLPELEKIADELYALKPDGFAAARDEQVKKARKDGNKELAKELTTLRRPTQSAWLVNQLWRDQHEVMEQLFELAEELSRAQARASGEELRTLTTQRRGIESALMGQARALAHKAGVNLTPEMEREVQETLSAALAQPEAADQVRTGRLVKPIEYAGFGTFPTTTPSPRAEPRESREPTPIRRREPEEDEQQKRARERVEAAKAAALEAGAAVEAARSVFEDRERDAKATQEQLDDVEREMENLRKRQRDLEDDLSKKERATREARREVEQKQQEHADAVKELEQAERELKK